MSEAGDRYEVEAERTADVITRSAAASPGSTISPYVHRARRDPRGETPPGAGASLEERLARTAGGGTPIAPAARDPLESRFGVDFRDVRVHQGGDAASLSDDLNALAFTHGRDIYFGRGKYDPGSAAGQRLLAHELTHVVQQAKATSSQAPVQRQVAPEYVVDESFAGRTIAGAAVRIFFARNSAVIPTTEMMKIVAFKSGPDRAVNLELLGLATEDEIAAIPTLPLLRANAVNAALGTPLPKLPPLNTKHTGTRKVTAGTVANTVSRPNLRFNRAVEVLRPGEPSMSPATAVAPATACNASLEADFQAAKVMAFDWIDTTRPELQVRPVAGSIAASLDHFFGSHDPTIARRVDHNLGLIRAEVDNVSQPVGHDCADPNLPSCVGAIAFNSGGVMTICSGYATHTPEDRARNLVHEAGHSTASLRIRGLANAPRTSDFSYRHERLINLLGAVNPDEALANSDSYSMLLMSRRAPGAITPDLLPTTDPAPTGFANVTQSTNAQRALALAQVWTRLASQGLTDLHGELRTTGTGSPVPTTLPDARLHAILAQVKLRFPPILSAATIRGDDLLMLAGALDRIDEISRLFKLPVSLSAAATTTVNRAPPTPPATIGSISISLEPGIVAAQEQTRARTIVNLVLELIPTSRITVTMRGNYGHFIEFSRDKHQ